MGLCVGKTTLHNWIDEGEIRKLGGLGWTCLKILFLCENFFSVISAKYGKKKSSPLPRCGSKRTVMIQCNLQ